MGCDLRCPTTVEKIEPNALVDGAAAQAVQRATGQKIYEYFGRLIDERDAEPADDIISRFLAAEVVQSVP